VKVGTLLRLGLSDIAGRGAGLAGRTAGTGRTTREIVQTRSLGAVLGEPECLSRTSTGD